VDEAATFDRSCKWTDELSVGPYSDLEYFLESWSGEADIFGWTDRELFGLVRLASNAWFGMMGLMSILASKRTVEMDEARAISAGTKCLVPTCSALRRR
jgi:hypothetical protein